MRYLALLLCIVSSSCSNERRAVSPDEANGETSAESDDNTARQAELDSERRNSANYLAADNTASRGASDDSYGAERMSPSPTTNSDTTSNTTGTNTTGTNTTGTNTTGTNATGTNRTGTSTATTSGVTPSGMGQPSTTEPGDTTDTSAAAADNTKKNKRDQSDASFTPMDQGTSESDRRITQDVRKAVMANDMLSFTAKNVKIITRDGRVTLRGPVKSEEERKAIEAAARKVAGDANVDNQLEITN